MIEKMFPLQYYKMASFTGSYHNLMRYSIYKKEDKLEVCIYPGPYAMAYTPEDNKEYFTFDFTDEGLDAVFVCLNQEYEKKDWKEEAAKAEAERNREG